MRSGLVAAFALLLAGLTPTGALEHRHSLRAHRRHSSSQAAVMVKLARRAIRNEFRREERKVQKMEQIIGITKKKVHKAKRLLLDIIMADAKPAAAAHPAPGTTHYPGALAAAKQAHAAQSIKGLSDLLEANKAKREDVVKEKEQGHLAKARTQADAQKAQDKRRVAQSHAPGAHDHTKALLTEQKVLKNLFDHLKGTISHSNGGDKKEADDSKKRIEKLKKQLAKDQAKLKDRKNMSVYQQNLLVNCTRIEEQEIKYWSRDRELQHSMFHSSLKLTHSLMARVQAVMKAYKDVLAKGKMSPELLKDLDKASSPKAFLQMRIRLHVEAKRAWQVLRHASRHIH